MRNQFVVAAVSVIVCLGAASPSPAAQPKRSAIEARKSQAAHNRAAATSGRNYDVRRGAFQRPQLSTGASQNAAAQRQLAAETYLKTMSATIGEEIRATWSDFGLPKSLLADRAALAPPSGKEPQAVALEFLKSHPALFPLSETALGALEVTSQIRSGAATYLTLQQTINNVRVFRGLVQVTVDGSGQVIRAGAGEVLLHTNVNTTAKLTVEQAVQAALSRFAQKQVKALAALPSVVPGRFRFRNPIQPQYSPLVSELAIFPLSADSGRLAWRIYLQVGRGRTYEVLIDAVDGSLLHSQNITHTSGKARVWRESPLKGEQELVDLLDEWLAPGATVTTGNNVDAYLDADSDDLPDSETTTELSNGRAFSASQFFVFPAGEGSTGQDPTQFKAAAVTNLFFLTNLAHDYYYSLGFNEAAGNFQTDNFNLGGLGNDAVLAEAQDPFVPGGIFHTMPDGEASRMEISIQPGPTDAATDNRDGSYDGMVVFHEYAHGVSDRLVGGPSEVTCLFGGAQSTALAEGYSDYFAISYYNNPVLDAYLSYNDTTGFRRFSYENHPLLYEDLGNQGFESHNDGEIWAAALWELRKTLGQPITDKVVLDSLSAVPCNPTMVDARDAILSADQAANGSANRQKIWEIFAKHGLGYSSRAVDGVPGSTPLVFDAAYDLPPDLSSGNRNPSVISRPPVLPVETGKNFIYVINATDPDNDPLTYELAEGPEGMTVDARTGRVDWMPTFTARRAKIRITDGKGGKVLHGLYIPVYTVLAAGQSVAIDGPLNSLGIALTIVPAGTKILQVTLRGGTGDPDLILIDPNFDIHSESSNAGTEETLSVASPQAGFWAVLVGAFEAYQGVSLAASLPIPETVTPGTPKTGLTGGKTSETFYEVTVPDGVSSLHVTTSGGTGDVNVFVRQGDVPACNDFFVCEFDGLSLNFGNGESVRIPDVPPGDWYINLSGYRAYDGVTLLVSVVGPDFTAEGVTNGASFLPPVGPGAIFTIFGKKLATAEAVAGTKPLPPSLGTTSVTVNGVAAPLYYVSPLQINAQMPFETPPGEATVVVKAGDLSSAEVKVTVLASAPGLFLYNNRAIVQNADGQLNDPNHPASVGTWVVAYLTGVSPLDNPIPTGAPAPLDPLSACTAPYSATIGGQPAEVYYLGMTPTFVGLAQANVKVPALPAGDHALKIKIGEVESNSAVIAVSQ